MFDARMLIAGNESDEKPNPFQIFSPGSKLSFSQITEKTYQGFNTIGKTTLSPLASYNPFSPDARALRTIANSNNYLDMAQLNIVVPPGFKSDLLGYARLLLSIFETVSELDSDVLVPVQQAITQTIGTNKEMGVATIDRYRHKVLFHTTEIQEFKDELKEHFDVDATNETLHFSSAFKRMLDYLAFNEAVDKLLKLLKGSNTAGISKQVIEISETANLLNLRLKQGKLEHLRDAQAEFITSLLIQTGTAVEFYAALVTMIQQLQSVRENIAAHLKRVTA